MTKPKTDFAWRKSENRICSYCRKCSAARFHLWAKQNPKRVKSARKIRDGLPENRLKQRTSNHARYKKHREKYCETLRLKNKNDPAYRLNTNVSRAIRSALGPKKRRLKCWAILGYSLEELKAHLEKQFQPNMSWDNYGKWHIDHIIPRSFFQFSSPDDVEFKMCWRLENLQPLWQFDNLSKHDKLLDFQRARKIKT